MFCTSDCSSCFFFTKMKKMITCFLLLFGQTLLFSASARERHLPPTFSSQRNGANPQGTLLENACNRKRLDLVFIIDSSRSVRPYDFEKVKEFILTILQFLDISPDVTRVGLLQYGSTVKHEFSLKTFRRKHDVERAVKRMMHLATGTMTGLAIQYALNIAFSESEGARPLSQNVPRIIMIVTDGRPQDPVAEVAAKARNSGILIFAIGVGRVDMNTLKSIGSEPHEEHVFLVADFSQIETLTSAFQTKLCVPHVCSITEHGCDHFCINTPASYMCKCKQGYILNADQKTCSTQDLCAVEKHACEQICVNTPGSYVCQCYDGYELDEDGKKCILVDLCALDNQGCQHECVSTDDSYYCRCHQGFILNPDRRTCRRPDYCALQTHGCQQECVNKDDSYFCQCRQGFTLNPDKRTCKRINFCALGKHGCEQECVNTEDSFVCRCHSGYTLNLDSKTCRRVDHCAENNHGCEQLCLNTGDSYVCQCSEGFIINEDLKTCTRVDYCALSDPGCEHLCVNSEKSYTCQCFEGYELRDDGKTCKRKNVCKSVNHGCEHVCVNRDNSYICKCREGFALRKDGKTCRNKDLCKSVDHGCEHVCVNTDNSYICKCRKGFVLRGDGKTCRNKDVCKSFDHGCEHICVNNDHSYICKCQEGFVLREDGKTCRNKNVCKSVNHGCEHVCVNNDDSYTCQCHEGFVLREDGKTCRNKDLCKSIDHGCEHVCVNDDISYTCQCHEGFILRKDEKTCRFKDPCKSVDPGCEHICVNTDSSYICKCHEGFVLREDGKTCRNKDLCKTVDHGCEHICINNDLSYVCKCHKGFVLQEDGKMCRRCTEGPIDLVFVIDGSKSLGEDNFEVVKEFVSGILDSLEISPKAARVGLLQYSTQVRTEFTLRQFSTAKDMKKAVSQMNYMGKGSMTGLALKQMFERSFTEAEGARPFSAEVPRVSIVVTDGRAQDEVSEWASKAKQNGITIYAVGIGKAIEEELLEIASEPPDKHLFYAEDFSTMGEISEKLKKQICEALEESDPHQHPLTGRPHNTGPHSSGSEPASIAVTDLLACSNFAVHHKYLFEEESVSQSTRSANPSKDKKEQCNCENLITFQNHANAEVKKLTQRLEEITKRMEALENRLRY
ncbi:matrilin-2 isoform X1 [Chelonia mydas]|uniref:matrilin-2 isoform X1 n=2 Tax=Chelonia mydas TaxID=8469 RepID=UPI001CA833D5|nr:matrilin-2 isoform X1 [Chelonia mydas]